MIRKTVSLDEAKRLPLWRQPITLLFVMGAGMPIAFYTWATLLNNFVKEAANFSGFDLGVLHMIREVPGFLAVLVIYLLFLIREQRLGLLSLTLLGLATAVTAHFPSYGGIMALTLLSSIGFHYYETVNQSLQLQWLPKDKAPQILSWIMAGASVSTLIVYGTIKFLWEPLGLTYNLVYMLGGLTTATIAIAAWMIFPQFEAPHPQEKKMVLRRRYWLYYALQFLAGARRQIFMVFAGWMMVERFNYGVDDLALLYLINYVINIIIAPLFGLVIARFGERNALVFEYAGLVCVFLAYAGVYYFEWSALVAAILFILDHIFFGLALALKTYFQKIGAPEDMAPTAAVAFTINHIAAVGLPALLGLLWLTSPAAVFIIAALIATSSLILATMIPRHPKGGHETVFAPPLGAPAE
jgi:hypothetical protein